MTFKAKLASEALMVGTFVKTPSPIIVEVLSLSGLDCLCLDAEHAPFDRGSLDLCIMAARAAQMPVLVRLSSVTPEHILNALDCGASGVVLPHITSALEAKAAVKACRYGPGGRGYAGSTRAAGYTTQTLVQNLSLGAQAVVIAQIEDIEAVLAIDEIMQVEGIDAFFIGRADLTVAMGAQSQDDPEVLAAVEAICAAGQRHKKTVGMFVARPTDVGYWQTRGARLFLLESDHSFILKGAKALKAMIQ
jgi:2-keto-3-deoxy-L-rhamnonate aldolase RhmA